jgi:hypothetical protein
MVARQAHLLFEAVQPKNAPNSVRKVFARVFSNELTKINKDFLCKMRE